MASDVSKVSKDDDSARPLSSLSIFTPWALRKEEFLLSAVRDGDLSRAKYLLECGVSPHTTDWNGATLMSIAKKSGDSSMLTLLEEYRRREERLQSAVKDGDHSEAKRLLECGISPHITDRHGKSLLGIAVKSSDLHMCTLLLENFAIAEDMKQSLLEAAGKGNHYRASLLVAVIDGNHRKALLLTGDDADPTYSKGVIQHGISYTGSDHDDGVQHKYSTGTQMNQLTQERKMVQEMLAALLLRMMMALEMLGIVALSMNIMESQKVCSVIQDEYIGMTKQEWKIGGGVREKSM